MWSLHFEFIPNFYAIHSCSGQHHMVPLTELAGTINSIEPENEPSFREANTYLASLPHAPNALIRQESTDDIWNGICVLGRLNVQ